MDFSSTAPLPFSDVRIIIPDECVCQPDGENLFFFIKIRLLPIFFFAFLRLSFTEKILYTIYRFFLDIQKAILYNSSVEGRCS